MGSVLYITQARDTIRWMRMVILSFESYQRPEGVRHWEFWVWRFKEETMVRKGGRFETRDSDEVTRRLA
jgi:hypothetical protein